MDSNDNDCVSLQPNEMSADQLRKAFQRLAIARSNGTPNSAREFDALAEELDHRLFVFDEIKSAIGTALNSGGSAEMLNAVIGLTEKYFS